MDCKIWILGGWNCNSQKIKYWKVIIPDTAKPLHKGKKKNNKSFSSLITNFVGVKTYFRDSVCLIDFTPISNKATLKGIVLTKLDLSYLKVASRRQKNILPIDFQAFKRKCFRVYNVQNLHTTNDISDSSIHPIYKRVYGGRRVSPVVTDPPITNSIICQNSAHCQPPNLYCHNF